MATFSGTPNNDIKLSGFDILIGNNGNDQLAQNLSTIGQIQGNNGDDLLYFTFGGAGTIQGGEGNDSIDGNSLGDHLYGDQGDDRISGLGGKDDLYGVDGRDLLDGGPDDDLIFGGIGNDSNVEQIQFPFAIPPSGPASLSTAFAGLYGGEGNDYVDGGEGNDYVDGGDGVDVLVGGLGADGLNGGNDGDIFRYFSAKESKRGDTKADHILDFEVGFDEIDLREMDANKKKDGLQKFKFIGKKGFHEKAGELHYKGGKLEADVNGDGKVDWLVFVDDKPKLSFDDFNL